MKIPKGFRFSAAAAGLKPQRRDVALVVLSVLVTHVVTTFFMTPEVSTSEIFWIAMGAGLAATAPETRLRHG